MLLKMIESQSDFVAQFLKKSFIDWLDSYPNRKTNIFFQEKFRHIYFLTQF